MYIKVCFLVALIVMCYYKHQCISGCGCCCKEGFQGDITELYDDLMDHYREIFPSGNRNAGGPQWYAYIDSIASGLTRDEFMAYHQFYCGVSGSPVDPRRAERGVIQRNVTVKDLNQVDVVGSYFHCCWPCLCDVMRYTRVEEHTVTLRDGDFTHNVLTIGDPCVGFDDFPENVDSYVCQDGMTQNGIRTSSGRLIYAVLHEPLPDDSLQETNDLCEERMATDPDELRGGMGDIFVKLSLINP
tara:strand:- start:148 stop:876 length:729 start_codon:yes stop_codon:yes gene_type:complete